MIAIIRKDIREWFAGGATGRYGQYEFLIYVGLVGILLPLLFHFGFGTSPRRQGGAGMTPFIGAVLPVFLAIYTMADAFAGERERGTFETLLVTPLRSTDIVIGKWLAGLGYAALIMVSTSLASTVMGLILGSHGIALGQILAIMACALLIAGLLAAIEILIALRAPTVKSAIFALNITIVIVGVALSQLAASASKTFAAVLAPIIALGTNGLIAIGAGVVALIMLTIGVLLWIATQQLRATRLE